MKKFNVLMVFVMSLLVLASVSAANTCISLSPNGAGQSDYAMIEVNGVESSLFESGSFDVKRGENIDITVVLSPINDLDNAEIEASIRGYDHNDREVLTDVTEVFNMKAGVFYKKKLSLDVPTRIDSNEYELRIELYTRDGSFTQTYTLFLNDEENEVVIKDAIFNPDPVKAGESVVPIVRVKNYGQRDEEDVKITVEVKDLGIKTYAYIDSLEAGHSEETDQDDNDAMVLNIPDCAEAGEYEVKVTARYDEGDETATEYYTLDVVSSDSCSVAAKSETRVASETAPLPGVAGEAIVYPVVIANTDSVTKAYEITVSSADWADFTISPASVVVVEGQNSEVVYLYATPKADAEGKKAFFVNVVSGDETKQVVLQADIAASEVEVEEPVVEESSFKKSLEVGLIVLVVVLVIIGFVIIFSKLVGSNDDEDEDDEAQTYY